MSAKMTARLIAKDFGIVDKPVENLLPIEATRV
jgi:hypothetical protein